MPSTPYIRVLTAINGDTPTLGARTVVNGDTIAFTYESVVGWASDNVARLEFFSYPDGWAGPGAPWITESVSVVYNGTTITYDAFVYTGNTAPPSFTAPAGPAWGKYLLASKLGNGQKAGLASSDMYDESSGFEILSSQGLHDAPAWRESDSFAEDRPWTKWTEDARKNLVIIDATLAAMGPLSNVTPAAVGTATAGVAVLASRSDHVHAHGNQLGGSLHADVIAAGASGFMTGADKTKLDNATSAATADVIAKRTASTALLQASGFTNGSGTKASAGTVRGGTGETIVAMRNNANDADISVLRNEGDDLIHIGSGAAACLGTFLDANGATGKHDLAIDGATMLRAEPSGVTVYGDLTTIGLKPVVAGSIITGAATLDTSASTVCVDAAAGSFSLALLPAASVADRIWTIIKVTAANTVTLDADGTEKINGALTFAITAQWKSITIQAINKPAISEWIVIGST